MGKGMTAVCGCVLAAGAAMGQPIAIDDPGFEETVLTPCSYIGGFGPASGWRMAPQQGNGGAWRPGSCWDMHPPEGLQVAYSNGGLIEQTLTTTGVAGATYVLSVTMGNRNHGCCVFTDTAMELWAGPTLIGRRIVTSAEAPLRGGWGRYTATFTAPGNLPAGQLLEIRFDAIGAQTDFDIVTLEQAGGCSADFNRDGFLDFFDYDDYVGCFETGSCPPGTNADFNGDGFADFFDYDDFVAAFQAGC